MMKRVAIYITYLLLNLLPHSALKQNKLSLPTITRRRQLAACMDGRFSMRQPAGCIRPTYLLPIHPSIHPSIHAHMYKCSCPNLSRNDLTWPSTYLL
ncbi:hypothetical protein F4779DRAFT_358706 [Xylariaceae sp. FL0662B]|nr:hypothetical protein F4779DRAFT_358706 [Xylariaceae sp. FL0662B]